jgi:hypothetical protein
MTAQKSDFESGKNYVIKTATKEFSGVVSKAGDDGVLIGSEEAHVPYSRIISFEEVVLSGREGSHTANAINDSGKQF